MSHISLDSDIVIVDDANENIVKCNCHDHINEHLNEHSNENEPADENADNILSTLDLENIRDLIKTCNHEQLSVEMKKLECFDINTKNNLFNYACAVSNKEIVVLLFGLFATNEKQDLEKENFGFVDMIKACTNKNGLPIIQFLFETGANPDKFGIDYFDHGGNNCITMAAYHNNMDIVKYFIENIKLDFNEYCITNSTNQTLLQITINQKNYDLAQYVLEQSTIKKSKYALNEFKSLLGNNKFDLAQIMIDNDLLLNHNYNLLYMLSKLTIQKVEIRNNLAYAFLLDNYFKLNKEINTKNNKDKFVAELETYYLAEEKQEFTQNEIINNKLYSNILSIGELKNFYDKKLSPIISHKCKNFEYLNKHMFEVYTSSEALLYLNKTFACMPSVITEIYLRVDNLELINNLSVTVELLNRSINIDLTLEKLLNRIDFNVQNGYYWIKLLDLVRGNNFLTLETMSSINVVLKKDNLIVDLDKYNAYVEFYLLEDTDPLRLTQKITNSALDDKNSNNFLIEKRKKIVDSLLFTSDNKKYVLDANKSCLEIILQRKIPIQYIYFSSNDGLNHINKIQIKNLDTNEILIIKSKDLTEQTNNPIVFDNMYSLTSNSTVADFVVKSDVVYDDELFVTTKLEYNLDDPNKSTIAQIYEKHKEYVKLPLVKKIKTNQKVNDLLYKANITNYQIIIYFDQNLQFTKQTDLNISVVVPKIFRHNYTTGLLLA